MPKTKQTVSKKRVIFFINLDSLFVGLFALLRVTGAIEMPEIVFLRYFLCRFNAPLFVIDTALPIYYLRREFFYALIKKIILFLCIINYCYCNQKMER